MTASAPVLDARAAGGAWEPKTCATPPTDWPGLGEVERAAVLARQGRWRRRRRVWEWTGLKGPAYCGRVARGDEVEVVVGTDGDETRGHARGLLTCSSVHACPVCSATIRQGRAEQIERAARQWTRAGLCGAGGGRLLMLTLTLRHSRTDQLGPMLDGLMAAWRATTEGAPWKRWADRLGLYGYVRALEVTDGPNGWHPHLHVLLFTRRGAGDMAQAFASWADARWREKLADQGYSAVSGVGLDLRELRGEGAAVYVAKLQDGDLGDTRLGLEVARADLKRGRRGRVSPFEYLDRPADDTVALARWCEYEAATKGRRCIEASRGLFDRLGVEELTDEELAERDWLEQDGTSLVRRIMVPAESWADVCAAGWDFDVVQLACYSRRAALALVDRAVQRRRAGLTKSPDTGGEWDHGEAFLQSLRPVVNSRIAAVTKSADHFPSDSEGPW